MLEKAWRRGGGGGINSICSGNVSAVTITWKERLGARVTLAVTLLSLKRAGQQDIRRLS